MSSSFSGFFCLLLQPQKVSFGTSVLTLLHFTLTLSSMSIRMHDFLLTYMSSAPFQGSFPTLMLLLFLASAPCGFPWLCGLLPACVGAELSSPHHGTLGLRVPGVLGEHGLSSLVIAAVVLWRDAHQSSSCLALETSPCCSWMYRDQFTQVFWIPSLCF